MDCDVAALLAMTRLGRLPSRYTPQWRGEAQDY